MTGVVGSSLDVARPRAQLLRIVMHAQRRIELVTLAGKIEHRRLGWLVEFARVPVAGQSAADPDQAAQSIRISEGKPKVERAALREAEQKHFAAIRRAVGGQGLDQIVEGLMMQGNGFFGTKIGEPAETETQWTTRLLWILQVLMKTLEGSDREMVRGHQLRLAHHLTLVGAVAV